MIEFVLKYDFEFAPFSVYENWIKTVIESEQKICGAITYIFCDDDYLDQLNQKYLQHTDYTDIISFDYGQGNLISGDIFISVERVEENAEKYGVSFQSELLRVMAHGILHYCGYKDKTPDESALMRKKEEEKMQMFHVEH